MICPNCGADMEMLERCPYCGTENESVAKKHQETEISGIYAKIAALRRAPQDQGYVKRITIAVVTILCITAIVTLAVFLKYRFAPERDFRLQTARVEQLEDLCDAGDFDGMNHILRGLDDSHKTIYDKYTILGGLYEELVWVEENLPADLELAATYPEAADYLNYDFDRLFYVLTECQKLEDAGWVFEEEDAVTLLRQRAIQLLTDELGLTEAEIARGLEIAGQEDPDYTQLSLLVAQRLEDTP